MIPECRNGYQKMTILPTLAKDSRSPSLYFVQQKWETVFPDYFEVVKRPDSMKRTIFVSEKKASKRLAVLDLPVFRMLKTHTKLTAYRKTGDGGRSRDLCSRSTTIILGNTTKTPLTLLITGYMSLLTPMMSWQMGRFGIFNVDHRSLHAGCPGIQI